MRSVAAVAIVVGLMAMPGWAQHGGSHGGFSGHSGSFSGHSGSMGHSAPMGHVAPMGHSAPMGHAAPISHGSYPNPGPMRFGAPVRTQQGRPPYVSSYAHGGGRGTGWNQGGRDHDGDRDHRRRPYYRGFGLGLGYGYTVWPGYPFLWNDPGFYGYDDSNYGGNSTTYADANAPVPPYADYGEPMPAPGYAEPVYSGPGYSGPGYSGPGYAGEPAPYNYGNGAGSPSPQGEPQGARRPYTGPSGASDPPSPQQAVTVIFKDGRPSEQIHNYLLTASTLTVLDQKYREIPVDQINLGATEETNRADGIDFRVPSVQALPQPREDAPAN